MKTTILFAMTFAPDVAAWSATDSQAMPAEYQRVLETLGKKGDYKDSVLKINFAQRSTCKRGGLSYAHAVRLRRLARGDQKAMAAWMS